MSAPETLARIEAALASLGGRGRLREIQRAAGGMNITVLKNGLRDHPGRFEKETRGPRMVLWRRKA